MPEPVTVFPEGTPRYVYVDTHKMRTNRDTGTRLPCVVVDEAGEITTFNSVQIWGPCEVSYFIGSPHVRITTSAELIGITNGNPEVTR